MAARQLPPQDYLRKILDYNPETGVLTWKKREGLKGSWNAKYAGKPAFTSGNGHGYWCGAINSKNLLAHRVIWKLVYGSEPDQIDHINGIRSDNRLENLRNVSPQENQRNCVRQRNNVSGATGVIWNKQARKWHSKIVVNGKELHLGFFVDFEAAVAARKNAEVKYNFHANHGRAA